MAQWIWYPGDFEIYQGMMQNFSREERGMWWPAYWYIDDCRRNVRFERDYVLAEETAFTVTSNSMGYIRVNDVKHRFGERIVCGPGPVQLRIFAGAPTGVPSIYVEGPVIFSDRDWTVSDMIDAPIPVGCNDRYVRPTQDPSVWEYDARRCTPQAEEAVAGGVLYDFGEELTAEVAVTWQQGFRPVLLCYGESRTEALDLENCYYSQQLTAERDAIPRRAFRYVYIPEIAPGEVSLTATHTYIEMPVRGTFSCGEELLDRIWNVSATTFHLASGIFFIDGVKRDRWIWAGDAYQSQFINQYLFQDHDICKRTAWALRGNDPIRQHINTIVDYSMYWLIGILQYYRMSGDIDFVRAIYPRMQTMMDFLLGQLDENGFLVGRPDDWIFIDWADMDKEGPICAEQILLAACYETMIVVEELLEGEGAAAGAHDYAARRETLLGNIESHYWDAGQGAYIDGYTSGRRHVTRHANIFAVLFGIADAARAEEIFENVIQNPEIAQITTPYFKFYELEMLCRMGHQREALAQIRSYWGGMLAEGATTFWEEYDPTKTGADHYEMYGDPYGKSLCHAWAASPIYLLGRYIAGVYPTAPGYAAYLVEPDTTALPQYHFTLPAGNGDVTIDWDGTTLRVTATRPGGTLRHHGQDIPLQPGIETAVQV